MSACMQLATHQLRVAGATTRRRRRAAAAASAPAAALPSEFKFQAHPCVREPDPTTRAFCGLQCKGRLEGGRVGCLVQQYVADVPRARLSRGLQPAAACCPPCNTHSLLIQPNMTGTHSPLGLQGIGRAPGPGHWLAPLSPICGCRYRPSAPFCVAPSSPLPSPSPSMPPGHLPRQISCLSAAPLYHQRPEATK